MLEKETVQDKNEHSSAVASVTVDLVKCGFKYSGKGEVLFSGTLQGAQVEEV